MQRAIDVLGRDSCGGRRWELPFRFVDRTLLPAPRELLSCRFSNHAIQANGADIRPIDHAVSRSKAGITSTPQGQSVSN